jgi:glycosyltransferase involved in cell wall biosynthesis
MSTTPRTRVARVITRMNIGGPAWHVTILSTRLGPEFETRLLVGEEDAREGSMFDTARAAGAEIVHVPGLKREPSPVDDLRVAIWLYRYFRVWRPQIVATHMAKAGALGRTAAFLARVPIRIHTFHGHVLEGYFGATKNSVYATMERLLDLVTTRFVAISPMLKRDLERMGIGKRRTALIRLGLDLERFAEVPARGALRAGLGISPEVPLVGIVGRLVPIKGHDLFLEMAARVVERKPDAHFVIVGDGELWDSLQQQVQRLRLGERVHLTGWRQDLENVYGDLDVLVCSSLNEGTPVSVIEAGAAGVPVVATDVGGVRDVIVDGETGLLAASGDAASLARRVIQVLNDRALAEAMSAAARRWVTGRYSADRLVDDIRTLYLSLLPRQAAPDSLATPTPRIQL